MRLVVALTALLILFSNVVSAGIYKWVDANGAVHFSDTPPGDKKVEIVRPQYEHTADEAEEVASDSRNFGQEQKPIAEKEKNSVAEKRKINAGQNSRELTEDEKAEKRKAEWKEAEERARKDPEWVKKNKKERRRHEAEIQRIKSTGGQYRHDR